MKEKTKTVILITVPLTLLMCRYGVSHKLEAGAKAESLKKKIQITRKSFPFTDKEAIRAIVGEASDQGYTGMLAVACGIRNRGTLNGVFGKDAKHVVSEPAWVWRLATKAWRESEYNRVHIGYMWENLKAFDKPSWYDKVVAVYKHRDHVFFVEKNN